MTMDSGAGGFHRGIQGQDIGLEGNVADQFGDLAHFVRAVGNCVDGIEQAVYSLIAPGHLAGGVLRQMIGGLGLLRVLAHGVSPVDSWP
uniref:Uncharacterized protein n=1 Tax=Panagrolaimus superbus TaxID=310955 RepID=A0A914YLE5_9BILA